MVVPNEGPVVQSPCYEAIADEADQRQTCSNRHQGQYADRNEAGLEDSWQWMEAVRIREVRAAIDRNAWAVRRRRGRHVW